MDRIPFWFSLGVGTPANDPSPRKRGPSSVLEIWAASRIVKGLTRTVTVIEEAPSEEAMMEFGACLFPPRLDVAGQLSRQLATPCGRQGQVVLASLSNMSKVTMEDEECVELEVYGVRDAVFSESLLNVISFVDGGACCLLLVAPSNGYRVAISLHMPWHLLTHTTATGRSATI